MVTNSYEGVSDVEYPSIATSLDDLIGLRLKYATVYADPPWQYDNTASRAAAADHYATLSVKEICAMPVHKLCLPNSHLHLWTTTSFLPSAFEVIDAWGFTYKCCFVWIKPQLGLGNYWRISHELMLLGVRGNLPFADNACRSWLSHRRRRHSQKPYAIRELVERVSPGPYLELFGRVEIPNSKWTVFGNQVERRLF